MLFQPRVGRIGNPTYFFVSKSKGHSDLQWRSMKEFYLRHLPHWQPQDAIFFVTFRLKNSLPYEVIKDLREEREREKISRNQRPGSGRAQPHNFEQHPYFTRQDTYLDKAEFGPRWLAQPEIAEILREALHYRDGKVYDLHTFCIMPNHVHAVFGLAGTSDYQSDQPLYKIMQSLKRHTARQANLLLGREGAFWQDESYDRVIRNSKEYMQTISYVLENPVSVGLASRWNEWPWTYIRPEVLSA